MLSSTTTASSTPLSRSEDRKSRRGGNLVIDQSSERRQLSQNFRMAHLVRLLLPLSQRVFRADPFLFRRQNNAHPDKIMPADLNLLSALSSSVHCRPRLHGHLQHHQTWCVPKLLVSDRPRR